MDINWDKYNIVVRNDDAIKHNRILFDFMQQTFNYMDELYLRERCISINKIIKDQLRKQLQK